MRWVMIATIVVDLLLTLHGQPSSYWRDSITAIEPNPPVRHLMVLGILPFLAAFVIYCVLAFVLASVLPPWIAGVTSQVFTLGHFYAGSTWLEARMGLGMNGVYLYAVPLAIVIMICVHLPADPEGQRDSKRV